MIALSTLRRLGQAFRIAESRHVLAVEPPAPNRIELLRRQQIGRLRLELLIDGRAVWQLSVGPFGLVKDLLAALAGLEPLHHQHAFHVAGRPYRFIVWPSLGIATVEAHRAHKPGDVNPISQDQPVVGKQG